MYKVINQSRLDHSIYAVDLCSFEFKRDSWLGPFGSRDAAESAAKLSGKSFHWCGRCGGFSK